MQRHYRGMTETNQKLMTEARDEALLALPAAFFKAAYARLASNPRRAASDAMRALGVTLFSHAPLRLANISGSQGPTAARWPISWPRSRSRTAPRCAGWWTG